MTSACSTTIFCTSSRPARSGWPRWMRPTACSLRFASSSGLPAAQCAAGAAQASSRAHGSARREQEREENVTSPES
eukprot:438650-Hanusia_phi.AAC.4